MPSPSSPLFLPLFALSIIFLVIRSFRSCTCIAPNPLFASHSHPFFRYFSAQCRCSYFSLFRMSPFCARLCSSKFYFRHYRFFFLTFNMAHFAICIPISRWLLFSWAAAMASSALLPPLTPSPEQSRGFLFVDFAWSCSKCRFLIHSLQCIFHNIDRFCTVAA